jgi:hypothetical protein
VERFLIRGRWCHVGSWVVVVDVLVASLEEP